MHRLLASLCAAVLLVTTLPATAFAQSDQGEIRIVITDAATKQPVPLARILLDGPVITNEFSGNNGQVRFTDVPDGIYRARIIKRGYASVTSEQFEVLDGKAVTVSVALAPDSDLQVIATVTAKSSAIISSSNISDDSAQRRLSNDLAGALNKLSGVSVSTSSDDSDATETISLDGHDASQTQLTLDGIPLNAPGSAGNLGNFATDLFSGASVRSGASIGGLAGGVNFRTAEPTLTWQSQTQLSTGSNGKYNWLFGETGTAGRLGIALTETYRSMPSLLDGLNYEDASGLDYDHDGDRTSRGTMLKLRYKLNDSQTLTGSYMDSDNSSNLVCARISGGIPCGYGPGNYSNSNYRMYSLTDTALIGDTSLQAAVYGTSGTNERNLLNRYVAGVASPTGYTSDSNSFGYSVNAQLPAKERHTISIQAYGSTSNNATVALLRADAPYYTGSQASSYGALTVTDAIQSSTKLMLNESFGLSQASNAPASLLASVAATWKPTNVDSYSASYAVGGVAAHAGRSTILTDPASLRFDCNADVAYGSAPGDQPGSSSSTSARFSYTHQWKGGLVSASLYRQSQLGIVLPTDVNGSILSTMGIISPSYLSDVQALFQSAAGCGAAPTVPFGAQDLYFEMPIGGVARFYQGGSVTGFFSLGNLVVQPFYNTTIAEAVSIDPRIDNPYSTTISGSQLPDVPMHRVGVTLDYKAPHSALEYLADAQYTSANNPNNLPAYTTYDAGVTAQLQRGTLTFAASNITDTYGGIFASPANAVPQVTAGGAFIPTLARPLSPRAYSVTYTVKFGAGAKQDTSRASSRGGGFGGPGGGRGGFGRFFQPLPSSAPADPLALNTANAQCTGDGQTQAKAILGPLKAYVAQIEAAKTSAGYPATMPAPVIPNLTVAYHGLGATYALTVSDRSVSRLRAVFPCLTLHLANADDVKTRNLFVPPATIFGAPSIVFTPSVGFYVGPRQPAAQQESFRLYKLPTKAPSAPFEIRASDSCTPEMKGLATQLLDELQKHFISNAPAPSWTITAHSAKTGTWYELASDDVEAIPAILNCGRIATAKPEELTPLGWDGARVPSLNYAPALGIYMVRGNFGQGGGRRNGASPSPSASPSPAPLPSATPAV